MSNYYTPPEGFMTFEETAMYLDTTVPALIRWQNSGAAEPGYHFRGSGWRRQDLDKWFADGNSRPVQD